MGVSYVRRGLVIKNKTVTMQEINGAPPGTFSKRDWKTDACVEYVQYNMILELPQQTVLFMVVSIELDFYKENPTVHPTSGPGPSPTSLRILWTVPPNHVFQPPSTIPTTTEEKKCLETKVKPLYPYTSYKWCYNLTSMCSKEQFSGVNWQFQGWYYHLHPL